MLEAWIRISKADAYLTLRFSTRCSVSTHTLQNYYVVIINLLIVLLTGSGGGNGKAWGCDLSYKYVEINAEYTT
jgi:N-acetylglutamate synthase/N-acetylornithine aminotransferase